MNKLPLLLLGILLCACGVLRAQSFDLTTGRVPVVSLDGLWRFHTGDDPAWADPNFDDSKWSLLRPDRSWADQGYSGYKGFAWYRLQLLVPPGLPDISINPPMIANVYEVYADGILIGAYGKMPPHREIRTFMPYLIYKIPSPRASPPATSRTVTIAIRVSYWESGLYSYDGGPLNSWGLLTGDSSQVRQAVDLRISSRQWSHTGFHALGFLRTLTAFGALALFLLRRRDLEYLWFSLNMFCAAVNTWLFLWIAFYSVDRLQSILWLDFTDLAGNLALLGFYKQLLRPRHRWLFRLAIVCVLLEMPRVLQYYLLREVLPVEISDFIAGLLALPFYAWILTALFATARRKSGSDSRWIDARLLLLPALLDALLSLCSFGFSIVYEIGWSHTLIVDSRYRIIEQPFPIELGEVTDALWLLGVFGVLVLRFARTRSEQERYATEVEGARNVQQFLIPDDLPKIPGLTIESDYRPAREVGGDFFQIIPDSADGSALIFIGDVAGKGMQAGMLATLLVGAMRTAAMFTRDPAVILSTLNNRLYGKGNATCVALKIEVDGTATLVNAGHLPPYLNGIELPMEGALPLGTIPNLDFPILHFQISPGDMLTLISDGILEAQKPDGELFGFDRITQHLASSTTASSLATAAQNFGQQDDITVLTVARLAPAMIG